MTRTFSAPVDVDIVHEACDLARRAPSAGFSQGTHFLLLSGKSLADFWRVSGAGDWFERTAPGVLAASPVVLVLADRRAYTDRYSEADKSGHGLEDENTWPVPYWSTDAAMAAQNLLLIVESQGFGALFFGLFGDVRATLDHFAVPCDVEFVGAIALGERSAGDRPSGSSTRRPRRPLADVVHRDSW